MKKFLSILGVAAVVMMSGCSEVVPPAHKGKTITSAGFQPDIYEPGRVHLGWNERLVLIETGTVTFTEQLNVLLDDRLEISFDVRGRMRIDGSDKIINAMFNDIALPKGEKTLSAAQVYSVYGRMLIRDTARSILSKYTVNDIHKKREQITNELKVSLANDFNSIPLKLSDITLGKVVLPAVVTQAVDQQKKRELEIETERNKVKIELEKKKGAEQVAQAEYRIKMLEAKRIRDYNKMIAEGVTSELLQLRALEVQEKMAERTGQNDTTVFMPYEAMSTTGANVRMYQK